MPFVRKSSGTSGRRNMTSYLRKRSAASKIQRAWRKRRSKGPSVTVIKSPSAFPDVVKVKLRYAAYHQLASPLGAPYTHIYRGNSLFDPDYTGTGHQPMGFDEWSSLYSMYQVKACLIKVTFSALTTNTVPVWVAIMAKSTNSTTTSIYAANERAHVRDRILYTSGNKAQTTISMYQTTRRMLGLTDKLSTNDTDFNAAVTANPNGSWYYDIVVGSVDNTTTTDIDVMVEIKYYATFFDRKALNQS